MGFYSMIIVCISFYQTYSQTTEVDNYNSLEKEKTLNLLKEINGGCKIIYDYCESIQYNEGFVFKESKPDCSFNYSYIDTNGSIYLFKLNDDVHNMIKDYKKQVCITEDVECGEYTIIINPLKI